MRYQQFIFKLLPSLWLLSLLLACTPPTAEEQAYARISKAPTIGAIDTFMLDFPTSQLIFKLRPLRDSLIVVHFADCSDCACEDLGAYNNQLISRFMLQLEALYEDCLWQRMQEAPSRQVALTYVKAFPEGQYTAMMKDELEALTQRVRRTFATNREEELPPEIYTAVLALLDYQLAHPEAGILVDFSFKNDYHKWSDYSEAERDVFIELYDFPNNMESLYATPPKSPVTDKLPQFDGQTFVRVLDDCSLGRALNFQLADAATSYTPEDLTVKVKGGFEIAMLEGTQVPVILPIESTRQRNGIDQGKPSFEGYRFGLQLRTMVSFQTAEEAAPQSFSFVTTPGEYMRAVQESMFTGSLDKPKYNTNYSDRPLYERMEQSMLSRVGYDFFTAMGASVDRGDRLIDDFMESNYYREALEH